MKPFRIHPLIIQMLPSLKLTASLPMKIPTFPGKYH